MARALKCVVVRRRDLDDWSKSVRRARARSEMMALEVAPTGVRVNAVLPGNIRTKMGLSSDARADDAENERRAARLVPQGRMGTAEEIADAVCFLASDAATHITGIELPVDGGILASSYGTALSS